MSSIQLYNSSRLAIVDDADVPMLSQFKWCYHPEGYALTRKSINGKTQTIWMHRLIMGATSVQKIDHKDGDRLNNQRSNLRFASDSNNMQNRRKQGKPTSSKYKGVFWSRNRWHAHIHYNHKSIRIGVFIDEDAAAFAYNAKAIELFGEFACVNEVVSSQRFEL